MINDETRVKGWRLDAISAPPLLFAQERANLKMGKMLDEWRCTFFFFFGYIYKFAKVEERIFFERTSNINKINIVILMICNLVNTC